MLTRCKRDSACSIAKKCVSVMQEARGSNGTYGPYSAASKHPTLCDLLIKGCFYLRFTDNHACFFSKLGFGSPISQFHGASTATDARV
jgi:hypothetical protein